MRFAMILALATALSVPTPAVAQAGQQSTAKSDAAMAARERTVQQALGLVRQKQSDAAIALLDPVIAELDRSYPASGPAIFCASDMAGTLFGLAVRSVNGKQVIAVDTSWCYAVWLKGYALVELGRLEDALVPLTRATLLMPDNAQFHTELGYVYQSLKRWKESEGAYAAALEAGRKMPDGADRNLALRRALFGLGYNEIELGKLDAAEAHMREALRYAPGDEKILNELDYIQEQRGKSRPG